MVVKKIQGRRGVVEVEGVVAFIVIAFAFVLTLVFTSLIVSEFNTGIQATNSSGVPAETKSISSDYNSSLSAFDIGFALLLLACLVTVVVVIRRFPERSGWFIVVGVVACFIFGLVGFVLENFWSGFNSGAVATLTSGWVFIPFFMDNFIGVLIAFIFVFVIAGLTSEGGINFG